MDRLFENSDSRDLSDLREKFYTTVPDLQKQIYAEAVKQGEAEKEKIIFVRKRNVLSEN